MYSSRPYAVATLWCAGQSLMSCVVLTTDFATVQVTDPYLNLFRGLVPPLLGTIDFTPLFGFLILQFLAGTLDLGAEDDW